MLDMLPLTGPIYLVILIGFLTTRFGLFSKADMRVIGKFVVNLALPALIFNAMAQRQIQEIINPAYLLAYFAGSLGVMAAGYLWCRRRAHLNSTTSAIYVMGMSCSNSGFVGYPILLLALAPVAGVSLALNMMVENVIVIPLLLALADRGRGGAAPWHQQVRQSAARLAVNPIILGLVAGLLVSLLGWELPKALGRTINMFAMASGALSLFVIGGALVGLPMQGMGRKVMPIVLGKLLVHPALVLLALLALPLLGQRVKKCGFAHIGKTDDATFHEISLRFNPLCAIARTAKKQTRVRIHRISEEFVLVLPRGNWCRLY